MKGLSTWQPLFFDPFRMSLNAQYLISEIKRGLKVNLFPGLVLQGIALLIVLSFYFLPASQGVFQQLSDWKVILDWKFGLISGAICGGIIPFTFLALSGRITGTPWMELVFLMAFWAEKGVEVFFLYEWQAEWFGTVPDWMVIAKKTAIDQFIFSALWAAPTISIAYLWKGTGYRWRPFVQQLNREFFTLKMPTIIVSNWLVWLPAIAIIYCLPKDLQLPVASVVQCFWVLLLATLNKAQ